MKVLSASISASHLNAGASWMLKMNTRVQEKTHSSTFRSRKDKRLSLNLDRGNADDARNSAKLALHLVFLSHSSKSFAVYTWSFGANRIPRTCIRRSL